MEFTRLGDVICELGESPLWDDRREVLFFVDIPGPAIHAIRLDGGDPRSWPMPAVIGSIGLTQSGRLIAALKHDLALFDPETGTLQPFATLPADEPTETRLNDGKVGPDGAFWVGSMHDVGNRQPIGALYRVARWRRHAACRGPARVEWPRLLAGWHADVSQRHPQSLARPVGFLPCDGRHGNRTRIATFDGSIGLPDGGATDADGAYWSAGIYAGRLNCFSASGELKSWHAVPVPAPTMPCFCGPGLRMLAITSLRTGAVVAQLDRFPESGGVFIAEAPVAGSAVARMPL